jgi:hypothetical protein
MVNLPKSETGTSLFLEKAGKFYTKANFPADSKNLLRQGAGDGAERVADLGTEQTHDSNDHNGDESENDRIFDETLALFLWCE